MADKDKKINPQSPKREMPSKPVEIPSIRTGLEKITNHEKSKESRKPVMATPIPPPPKKK